MKFSVDAGALCADKNHRFGNYIVTENLIKALRLYDHKNEYFFYTFCKKPHTKNLQPKIFWSTLRTSIEELIEKKDYYFALNQALPLFGHQKIISFSHGLSFHFYPKLYPDSAEKMKKQYEQMIKRSYKIIVPSIKVKEELISIFPPSLPLSPRLQRSRKLRRTGRKIECEVVVIPYGVPFDMINDSKLRITPCLPAGRDYGLRNKFFLAVGMDHPIKNQKILPKSKYKFIVANNVSRTKLKSLYQKATALVTTSLYESFNLPVLEALSQGCPVIGLKSAIIPELTPYVNVCKNEKELLYMLDQAENNKLKMPDVKEIKNKFSWKNYVTNIRIIVT